MYFKEIQRRVLFYAGLRLEAETKVLENQNKVFRDEKIRILLQTIFGYEGLLAQTEDEKEKKEIMEIIAKHKERVNILLADMDLSVDDLKPKYRCEKCLDSGFTCEGALCDCFYD